MLKIYKSNCFPSNQNQFFYTFFGGRKQVGKTIYITPIVKYPQVAELKLPTNVININEAEMGRFSPLRVRDISGPVINAYNIKHAASQIDITFQSDPHVNKYDCRGAVSLSSSMQSNVPSPFTGNKTHLNMPGSQWGQGHKYLSDHLHSAHYLTLRNEYRGKMYKAITVGARKMSTEPDVPLSAKEKLKKAVKDYGATVIVFHVTISLLSLGGCYVLVSSGVDVLAILKYFNIGEGALFNAVTSNAGTFVIAYGVHKIFAPARIAITLTATPFIVRYLRRIGILKSSASGGGK
ncbi:uncharacterized protein LOC120637099 isoform X1 [Pararge aegeria]|nr:uncharacterized protein LOC120637099 isoform X1 [Pararge aegeria]XP_039764672.1 uncharacterized protein LOC120637099 isoform X1 [Pararge aegeria]XP_039764673.1 uncharacterized protein LOC120637099 isoform X1 [Pararge aegeria]